MNKQIVIASLLLGGVLAWPEDVHAEQIPPQELERMERDLANRIAGAFQNFRDSARAKRLAIRSRLRQSRLEDSGILHYFSEEDVKEYLALAEKETDVSVQLAALEQLANMSFFTEKKSVEMIGRFLDDKAKSSIMETASEALYQKFLMADPFKLTAFTIFKTIGLEIPGIISQDAIFGHGVIDFHRLNQDLIEKNADQIVAKIKPLLKDSTPEKTLIEAMSVLSAGGFRMSKLGAQLLALGKHRSPAVAYHAMLAFQATMDRKEFAKIASDVKPFLKSPFWRVRTIAWDIVDESTQHDPLVTKAWKPSAERKKDPIDLVHLPMQKHGYYSLEY